MWTWVWASCGWPRLWDAPYVVTTGLVAQGPIAATDRDTLLVPTAQGLIEVDAEGTRRTVWNRPVVAVAAQGDWWAVATEDAVWMAPPAPPGAEIEARAVSLPGTRRAVDVTLDGHGGLWAIDPAGAVVHAPEEGRWTVPGAQRFVRGTEGVEPWVVTDRGVVRIAPEAPLPVVEVSGVVAAARDAQGILYTVRQVEGEHGSTPTLERWNGGTATRVAATLERPGSMTLGRGSLVRPENLYVSDASGSLDYIHLGP